MLDLEEPAAVPFTPQMGFSTESPTTPMSAQSHGSYGHGSGNAYDKRRTSFPASSYRSSAVLETGSAIPLQFSSLDEPREIQIRRARDSIVGMSSVLSDMKSQIDSVRRASSSSEPAAVLSAESAQISPNVATRADKAARIKALGAPWMPPIDQQPPLPTGKAPHGPPPAFKAPLSPLSPPEKIPRLQSRGQGSPLDNESFATAEEQVSDEDPNRAMPTLPRLSSAKWRDLLSPSPPKNPDAQPRASLRQAALGSDDENDNIRYGVKAEGPASEIRASSTKDSGVPITQHPDANARASDSDRKRQSMRGSSRGSDSDIMRDVYGVQETVKMRKVRQVPAVREVSMPAPQEAQVRDTRMSSDATYGQNMAGLDFGVPPVPPRHGERSASKRHHRYHSLGDDGVTGQHARTQSQPQPQPQMRALPSQISQRPRPQSQPTSRPRVPSHPRSQAQALPDVDSKSSSKPHSRSHSHSQAHVRSQSQSQPAPRAETSRTDDTQRKRNFTKKSIANLVETAPPDHVYDLDDIDLPGPERRLLEKFVNSLSKLSIEIQMDEGKREEGRRRLHNALRALDGWI